MTQERGFVCFRISLDYGTSTDLWGSTLTGRLNQGLG